MPLEVISLIEAMETGGYDKAHLVLRGEGWKWRALYTSGGLMQHIRGAEKIDIVTLEGLVAKANQEKR